MSRLVDGLDAMPLLGRFTVVGAGVGGLIGAIGGLLVGLLAYPPTAWFAVLEAGIPACLLGGILGLCAGLGAIATRRIHRLIGRRTSSRRGEKEAGH